ncbi:MAG: hypothetical protein GF307_13460, partial [candidate division Zixibacteria bacterium]|nr:hypothetical protein [candidate division Zixibacteria bacterium]
MMDNNSERMRDIEKMAVLGNLLAGIGHELRTPLSAIISNNDSFERSCKRVTDILARVVEKLDSTSRNELNEILENIENINESNKAATRHMLAVLNALRNFSRGDDVKMVRTDVNECLKTTLTIAGHELKGRIDVDANYGDIPMIMGNPNQLTQVFMNIIINSAQAIAANGKISIKTVKADDDVVVKIADDGNG